MDTYQRYAVGARAAHASRIALQLGIRLRRFLMRTNAFACDVGGAFMCILYPLGIPLLFAALMRHERRKKAMKARYKL